MNPNGVTRTKIQAIGVNVSESLIKGKEIKFELARRSSYRGSTACCLITLV